jgi:NAD(P)-dependent dehydrogenase (short-subunit alcohol dehydrogenase family)
MKLKGRTAMVTGATTGFGAAIAQLFASEGADLLINARSAEALERTAESLRTNGRRVTAVAGDVGDEATAVSLADAVKRDHEGKVHALVLNAGFGTVANAPFWDVSPEDFDALMRVNVRGVWLPARALVPHMPAGGAIVVMASMSSYVVYPGKTAYSASKGAALQLARGMAGDLSAHGVRVNALCPGICDTPLTRWFIDRADDPALLEREFNEASPLGRMGTAEEIARAALFLASDDSSYCHGTSLVCDGGLLIQ